MIDGAAGARWLTAVFAASLLLAACGDAAAAGAGISPVTTPASSAEPGLYPDLESPPSVTVRFFDRSIDLLAWSYCYGNVCADGFPPAAPPDVGSPDEVVVEFPLAGWSFTASFRPTGDECGPVQQMPIEATGSGVFVLRPAGRADTYDVTLFGQGDGDLVVTFRWTTPSDGALPVPEGRLAVLADHDGRVDSYGIELELTNLGANAEAGQSQDHRPRRERRGGHVRRFARQNEVSARGHRVLGRPGRPRTRRSRPGRRAVHLQGRACPRRCPLPCYRRLAGKRNRG